MVGKAYSGIATPVSAADVTIDTAEVSKFEDDPAFQTKIATHAMRDISFMRKVGHLIKPEYFDNVGEAAIVNMALRFYEKYNDLPGLTVAIKLFKTAKEEKTIRSDILDVAKEAFGAIFKSTADLSNSDAMAEDVAVFARHQAVSAAILKSVDLLEKKQFDKIETAIKMAVEVGVNTDGDEYDYYDRITERTNERTDRAAGLMPPTGVTTGLLQMDNLLYHRGWGKKELSCIVGGAKAGKTTALINFAKFASLAKKNVLYVTCEVAGRILAERLDASITDTYVKELGIKIHDVRAKVEALQKNTGALMIHEYPSGTLTPSMLSALIQRYKTPKLKSDGTVRPAIIFDLVVVDYGDIMAPDHRCNDAIENSKNIWLGLRAIAFEENVAMLTATQTNRVGYQAAVAKAEHVADDFNKVRTVDLMISINVTDEERAANEARLFFAASRNQESGFTIFIKQELAKMKFISSIIKIE